MGLFTLLGKVVRRATTAALAQTNTFISQTLGRQVGGGGGTQVQSCTVISSPLPTQRIQPGRASSRQAARSECREGPEHRAL